MRAKTLCVYIYIYIYIYTTEAKVIIMTKERMRSAADGEHLRRPTLETCTARCIWQAFGAPRLFALASLHAMHSQIVVVSMLPFVVIPFGW